MRFYVWTRERISQQITKEVIDDISCWKSETKPVKAGKNDSNKKTEAQNYERVEDPLQRILPAAPDPRPSAVLEEFFVPFWIVPLLVAILPIHVSRTYVTAPGHTAEIVWDDPFL